MKRFYSGLSSSFKISEYSADCLKNLKYFHYRYVS